MSRWSQQALIVLALTVTGAAAAGVRPAGQPESSPFPLRIVKLGGPLSGPDVAAHLEFGLAVGYNAVWVPSTEAGRWWPEGSGGKPVLDERFLDLARWCRARDVRLFVELRPVHDAGGALVFEDPESEKRLRRFVKLLRRRAGVHDVVLSFHGAPPRLTELRDLLRYGIIAAPAHVDLAARLARRLPPRTRLWLAPTISSDQELDDPRIRYGATLLDALAGLDPAVGIVWSGPRPVSPTLRAADLAASRRRLGGRRLLLRDRYPANQAGGRLAVALVLGPLRNREPAIAGEIAGYVTCPMTELGASRLPLSTIADFLRAPERYDPEASWQAALDRLAGDDRAAREALQTQATEWGGWIGELNYRTARTDNPEAIAVALRDPAAVASHTWTARRYPERMAALAGLDDAVFREALLEVMGRRLAIARTVPAVRELRARQAAGRTDIGGLVEQLRRERERVAGRPTILTALDRFLLASGVGSAVLPSAPPPRDPAR